MDDPRLWIDPPIIISITPTQLEVARQRLAQGGVMLIGTRGTVESMGVKLAFNYDGVGTLVLTVLSKPWYLPMGVVTQHIIGWFQEGLGT